MKTFIHLILLTLLFSSCSDSKKLSKEEAAVGKCKPAFLDTVTGKYVYKLVDKMPSYPVEGMDIQKYIEQELQHVRISDSKSKYSIMLQFVVDTDGSIIGERVFYSSNKNRRTEELRLRELEYLRAIRSMPKWNVGKCGDSPVPVLLSLPLQIDVKSE